MSQDTDIHNLFRQFDGQPAKYKDITRDEQSLGARHRWPLLEAIKLHQSPVPPARIVEAHAVDCTPNTVAHSQQHEHEAFLAETQDSVMLTEVAPAPLHQDSDMLNEVTPAPLRQASEPDHPAPRPIPAKTSWLRSLIQPQRRTEQPENTGMAQPTPVPSTLKAPHAQSKSLFARREQESSMPATPARQHKGIFETRSELFEQKASSSPVSSSPPPEPEQPSRIQGAQTPLKRLFGRLAHSQSDTDSPSDSPLRRG